MKPDPSRNPAGEDLDQFLERGYRTTSPEFEERWAELKRGLLRGPQRRSRQMPSWFHLAWLGAIAAAALLIVALRPANPPPQLTPQLRALLTLDATLARAQPLLDEEIRAAVLHGPAGAPDPFNAP